MTEEVFDGVVMDDKGITFYKNKNIYVRYLPDGDIVISDDAAEEWPWKDMLAWAKEHDERMAK